MRPYKEGEDSGRYFLELHLERYRAGDKAALLEVAMWAMHRDPDVPDDVARAFEKAVSDWRMGETRTLDKALGIERAKGWRQHDNKTRLQFTAAVYLEVKRLHEQEGMPLDERTFDQAGRCWNVGGTVAKEMYYMMRERIARLHADVSE